MRKNYYLAIAVKGGFSVAQTTNIDNLPRRLGDVRTFTSFEAADKAAQFIAAGKSDAFEKGTYINNR